MLKITEKKLTNNTDKKMDLRDKLLIQYIIKFIIKNRMDDLIEEELNKLIKELNDNTQNTQNTDNTDNTEKTLTRLK